MTDATDERRARIDRHVGDRIVGVERLRFFVGSRARDADEGDLQLRFASGVLRFRVAGDGERLEVVADPWQDPFAPPLSAENAEFVATHGAWRLVDVSGEVGFRGWIGRELAAAVLTRSTATLRAANGAGNGATMSVTADGDALSVALSG